MLLVGGGEALQAVAVLTGGPFALLALVALAGLTLSFYRTEGFDRPWLPWLSVFPTVPALPRTLGPEDRTEPSRETDGDPDADAPPEDD